MLTRIFLILTTGVLPLLSTGQRIEYYNFSLVTAYLPSCGSQSEQYLKTNHKTQRKASSVHWKHCKKKKRKNLPEDLAIESAINLFDSLMRLEAFTFSINPALIDSLKSRTFRKQTFKITDTDIDHFFNQQHTVTLKMKTIKQALLEGVVIDGAPYSFNLTLKRAGQDTLQYSFQGNFFDGVETENIKSWLALYLTYTKYPLFSSIPLVEDYFDEETLENILFRFIIWTKEA